MNIENIEYVLKNTHSPLILLSIIINKNIYEKDDLDIFMRFFLKYHNNLCLEYNIRKIVNNNIINRYYNIINKQNKILKFILKIKKAYPKKYFWKKDINEQIIILKNILELFLSFYDCTKSNITYIMKINLEQEKYNNNFHIIEIKNRLIKILQLLKISFFKENNILLITNYDFDILKFENKIKYFEYILLKCYNILKNYINYLELYEIFRNELENLLNPIIININICNDIDNLTYEDIIFINYE
jgi:hypothetical protein